MLMGINGADKDPEDPNEVKYYYQNWETCKASNIQLIFYAPKKALNARHTEINPSDVLVLFQILQLKIHQYIHLVEILSNLR